MARKPSIEVTRDRRRFFWVVLVKEGVDLAAQRIEAETARPVDEEGEFVVGRVACDGAPNEGKVTWVVECRKADDGRQPGAGGRRAHGQTLRMRVMPPFDTVTPGINGWKASTSANARRR